MKRRALSLLLVLMLVIGLLPAAALAEAPSYGLEYVIREDHVEITGYTGSAKAVVIPAKIAGFPVTSINDQAFYSCYNMTSISIPDSVTYIGEYAFYYCTNLTSICIPSGVTSIGDFTFQNCINLANVFIPDSVTYIGNSAFYHCTKLANISIPDSVTFIGSRAFYECTILTGITIPNSVTSIGMGAFYGCESLTSISIPDGVSAINENTFCGCSSLTSISVPDSVSFIGVNAFFGCESLTSISIPNSVTSIDWGAFRDCFSLTSISVPDSVTAIGDYAFAHCNSLSSIYFDGDAPTFADSTFDEVTANAYYPFGNPTWTVLKGYGGSISWVPYIPPFYDVLVDSFYGFPVLWALENGITTGATATTFNPGGKCLRAQVVTFLHRAAGNPEPTSAHNPFADVKSTDFFYKPVLWAVENGITNGVSAAKFGSYDVCNRAAVVTFLWRAAGSPEPESTANPFTDVKATDFFYKPVLWAVENGITNGISATQFGPGSPCNRAQVVTFLYRSYN